MISKTNQQITNVTGYFIIETFGIQVPSSLSVQPSDLRFLVSDIDGNCKTVSRLCFDQNSTAPFQIQQSQMGLTKKLSAVIVNGDGEALRPGQAASVTMTFTNRVDPPSPTIAPTPAPGDEGEKLRNVLLIAFGSLLCICLIVLVALCCYNKERKSERTVTRQELHEQLKQQQQDEEDNPYELSQLVPPQTTVGSYPMPYRAELYPSVQKSMQRAGSTVFFEDGVDDKPLPLPSGYHQLASVKNASGMAAAQITTDDDVPNFRSEYEVIDNAFMTRPSFR